MLIHQLYPVPERIGNLYTMEPRLRFPGGTAFRTPLLTLAMLWYGLRDRL